MTQILWIILAFSLVLLNAFFVAAEFAMVKLRRTQIEIIEETYGIRGRILAHVHAHLDAYLSGCQLGITLASLGLGWIGEPAFSELLISLFSWFGVKSAKVNEFFAFIVAFSFISLLHIIVGELMPKSLAIRQAEKVSVWTAVPLYLFYRLMLPAIWLLNTCANFLLKVTKLNAPNESENYYSTEELKLILKSSNLHTELSNEENSILEQTLDFLSLKVTDVMRPIDEMIALKINQPIDEVIQILRDTRYSRYPVVDEDGLEFVGIIHVKDLFAHYYETHDLNSLEKVLRPVLKVAWHLPARELLRKFREGTTHFAIIYRGSGTAIGFITLDNLLHILVGRIQDEFHRTKDDWITTPDGGFLINASAPIYTVERALDIDIFTDENITTLNGLILNKLGTIPTPGESIEFDDFTAVIQTMKGPRILQVKIIPKKVHPLEE